MNSTRATTTLQKVMSHSSHDLSLTKLVAFSGVVETLSNSHAVKSIASWMDHTNQCEWLISFDGSEFQYRQLTPGSSPIQKHRAAPKDVPDWLFAVHPTHGWIVYDSKTSCTLEIIQPIPDNPVDASLAVAKAESAKIFTRDAVYFAVFLDAETMAVVGCKCIYLISPGFKEPVLVDSTTTDAFSHAAFVQWTYPTLFVAPWDMWPYRGEVHFIPTYYDISLDVRAPNS